MVKVKDLRNQIGTTEPQRPLLHCTVCGGDYSANAGDYFMAKPSKVLKCCKVPMVLAIKRAVYIHVD